MGIPKETQDRIAADADKEYPFDGIISDVSANEHRRNIGRYRVGYIAGATAEAEKTDTAIDAALHKERNAMQAKMTEMEIGYLKQIQGLADALEALLNVMPKGDALRYIYAKEVVIAGRQLLQQFKDGKGKEVGNGA